MKSNFIINLFEDTNVDSIAPDTTLVISLPLTSVLLKVLSNITTHVIIFSIITHMHDSSTLITSLAR